MKRMVPFILLAITLVAFYPANAAFISPNWGYGGELGGSRGDNAGGNEQWRPRMRGYIQTKLFSVVTTQLGAGYTELQGKNTYNTKTLEANFRFLLSPLKLNLMFPYFYAGFGVTKDIQHNNTSYLPAVPWGIGLQSFVGEQLMLTVNAGYNIVLSDKLDGRTRPDGITNFITNGKHDSYYDFAVGLVYTGAPKSLDPDKDGLKNDQEKEHGTNPNKADTDGDGLNDGDEVDRYRTNPVKADSDDDGLNDGEEINRANTQPLKADSDNDGLKDGDEVNTYRSDPNRADSDLDALADGAEVNQYKTDPMKADTDGDDLKDGDEVNKYRSDPLKADSDSDGLKDGDEANYHSDPLKKDTDGDALSDGDEVNKFKTDPAKDDSDGDGLSDSAEMNKYHTDPLMVDTDDGGMIDGAEIKATKDPLDPKDDLFELVKGKKVVLRGINFDTNKSSVLPESEWILEKGRASMVAYPDVTVVISGHTDNVGSDEANRTLSQKRAQSVKDWLVSKGIPSGRIKVVGKGETEPMATNDTEEGRAQNRRMEFYVE